MDQIGFDNIYGKVNDGTTHPMITMVIIVYVIFWHIFMCIMFILKNEINHVMNVCVVAIIINNAVILAHFGDTAVCIEVIIKIIITIVTSIIYYWFVYCSLVGSVSLSVENDEDIVRPKGPRIMRDSRYIIIVRRIITSYIIGLFIVSYGALSISVENDEYIVRTKGPRIMRDSQYYFFFFVMPNI